MATQLTKSEIEHLSRNTAKEIRELQNSILKRALVDAGHEGGSDKLLKLITRNIYNRINSTRLTLLHRSVPGNKSVLEGYDLGVPLAYSGVTRTQKPIGRLYAMQERIKNQMHRAVGFGPASDERSAAQLELMRNWYGTQERILNNRHTQLRASFLNEPISWQQQIGLESTGVSDDFDYLRKQERFQQKERFARGAAGERGHKTLAAHRAKREFTHWYDTQSDYNKERFDLIQHYGGGPQGIAYAEEELQRRADKERKASEARASIRNKSEKLQALRNTPTSMKVTHNLLKKIGIHTGSSAKDFKKFSKQMDKMRSIPIVGKYFAGNPMVAGAALGMATIAAMKTFAAQADRSNEKAVSWSNAFNLYGSPSSRFQKAAFLAGIKDPRKIAELYGKLTVQYGDAETILDSFGLSMSGMGKREKTFFANALGLSPELVAMMDMYAGNLRPNENRQMVAKVSMAEVARTLMSTSDQGAWDKITALIGSSSVGARMADVDFSDVAASMKAIAESDIAYESNVANKNVEAATGVSNDSHNIQQNIVNNIYTNDTADGIASGVKRGADEARAVMEAFDGKSR